MSQLSFNIKSGLERTHQQRANGRFDKLARRETNKYIVFADMIFIVFLSLLSTNKLIPVDVKVVFEKDLEDRSSVNELIVSPPAEASLDDVFKLDRSQYVPITYIGEDTYEYNGSRYYIDELQRRLSLDIVGADQEFGVMLRVSDGIDSLEEADAARRNMKLLCDGAGMRNAVMEF